MWMLQYHTKTRPKTRQRRTKRLRKLKTVSFNCKPMPTRGKRGHNTFPLNKLKLHLQLKLRRECKSFNIIFCIFPSQITSVAVNMNTLVVWTSIYYGERAFRNITGGTIKVDNIQFAVSIIKEMLEVPLMFRPKM